MATNRPENLWKNVPVIQNLNGVPIIRTGNFIAFNSYPAIYWGPAQYTQEEGNLYAPPTRWKHHEYLKVPKVVRFIYEEWTEEPDDDGDDDDGGDDHECKTCADIGPDSAGSWEEYVTLPTYTAYIVGEPGTKWVENRTPPLVGRRYRLVSAGGAGPLFPPGVASYPGPPADIVDYTYLVTSDGENEPSYEDWYSGDWKVQDFNEVVVVATGLPFPVHIRFDPATVYTGSHLGGIQFLGGRSQTFTVNFHRRTIRWCTETVYEWGKSATTHQMQVFHSMMYDGEMPSNPSMEVMKQACDLLGPAKNLPDGFIDCAPPGNLYPLLGLYGEYQILTWSQPPPSDWIPDFARSYSCPNGDSDVGPE